MFTVVFLTPRTVPGTRWGSEIFVERMNTRGIYEKGLKQLLAKSSHSIYRLIN